MTRRLTAWLCAVLVVAGAQHALAQNVRTYTVRLSPLPVDGPPMMATIAGLGTATATLTGNRLAIEGTFQGLKSPATQVKLHRGLRGVRGTVVADLPAPQNAVAGTFSGTVELTASQLEDLNRNRLYLQLYSEKAADGNLWGWLFPQENKR